MIDTLNRSHSCREMQKGREGSTAVKSLNALHVKSLRHQSASAHSAQSAPRLITEGGRKNKPQSLPQSAPVFVTFAAGVPLRLQHVDHIH